MTLLVKNEIDIIVDNIKYHTRKGIDGFVIMDNGSTDGTLEALQELSLDCEMLIVKNPDGIYQQSKWMTQLAKIAKNTLKADFVISNDADEFWMVDKGLSYADVMRKGDSVVTVKRVNSVFTEDIFLPDYSYKDARYCIKQPLQYSTDDQLNNKNICMQLVPISPKVVVNPKGLIRIKGGNHRAKHLNPFGKRLENNITVIHFPIRSYAGFLSNIENRSRLLEKGASMGYHYKRWVEFYRKGELEEEFKRMAIKKESVQVLKNNGILTDMVNDIVS